MMCNEVEKSTVVLRRNDSIKLLRIRWNKNVFSRWIIDCRLWYSIIHICTLEVLIAYIYFLWSMDISKFRHFNNLSECIERSVLQNLHMMMNNPINIIFAGDDLRAFYKGFKKMKINVHYLSNCVKI